jgi:hypothetical protein
MLANKDKAITVKEKLLEAMLPIIIPFLAVKVARWTAALIATVGIAVSYVTGDWSVFSRSGSLIVVCALVLAFFDYTTTTKQFFDKAREFFGDQYEEQVRSTVQKLICEELKKYGIEKSNEELGYLVERRISEIWEGVPARVGGLFKLKSLKTELALAILGTLIWGFGDLFG